MNLLDNELVRKYFGCECEGPHSYKKMGSCSLIMSGHIIQAMQQPIRKGEKYLDLNYSKVVVAQSGFLSESMVLSNWHPSVLRLPDTFQKQECKCQCHMTACGCCVTEGHNQPTPSPEKCPHADIGHFHGDISNPSACPEAKPKDEPEKCKCNPWMGKHAEDCKPKDAVEEKIKRIAETTYPMSFDLSARERISDELRDLVRLAKNSVPECEGDH